MFLREIHFTLDDVRAHGETHGARTTAHPALGASAGAPSQASRPAERRHASFDASASEPPQPGPTPTTPTPPTPQQPPRTPAARTAGRDDDGPGRAPGYPFRLPIWRDLRTLRFTAPVTIFVGENGSGKSTVLEAMAVAARAWTVSSARAEELPDLAGMLPLAEYTRLVWNGRPRRTWFIRAEDFTVHAQALAQLQASLEEGLRELDEEYAAKGDKSTYAHQLARMPLAGSIAALRRAYGEGLTARSHGEGFLTLFEQKLRGPALYLMDEPEAALSPLRQLSVLRWMHEAVGEGAQFILATHSPLLMAYPGATLVSFDHGLRPIAYDDLPHVQLYRDFLRDPARYLHHLLT
ncbi:MAG: AAA family ATPase [Thermoflavifilum sp.]|nr:AAA family ATPase [Thermoflavifilum sp.]MCL6514145.1 AAA family ATPase [Alicyclobacillus sp.]